MTPIPDIDVQLMLRAKEGDTTAFEALVHKHRDKLVGYLFHRVFDHSVAEDLAQDTFFRAYRARERYEPTAKFGTWIYRIAQRLAINRVRDQPARRAIPIERLGRPMKFRQLIDPALPCDVALIGEARAMIVRRALSNLPARQRTAVLMHKYQDMNYAEIAAAFNCSLQCVKSLLFRAYSALRRDLESSDAITQSLRTHNGALTTTGAPDGSYK